MTVDKSPARVQRMFGQIAGRYDLLNRLLSLGIDQAWRRYTVRAVPAEGTGPILDVCTGTGDLALAYQRATEPAVRIVAADFCQEMLVIGQQKAAKRAAAGRVTFCQADTQRLPFPSDSFQIVSVGFGLRNVSDTAAGLREMVRVCQPGGRVAVLEFSHPTWQPAKGLYGWYFRRVLPRIGQAMARNEDDAYHYLPASVSEFPSGEALAERMREAGLEQVRYRTLTFGVVTLYVGRKP